MAGKVAAEAKVTNASEEKEVVEIKVKKQTNEELISQVASEAVRATMREFMPLFGELLEKVSQNQQTPVQATVKLEEDNRSVQAKVMASINRSYDNRISKNKAFMKRLASSPRSDYVIMSIPRVFSKYFGSQLPVSLNGSSIQVPVNGTPFRVHKLYVPIIKQALEYKDQKISFMEKTDFEDITEVPDVASIT